MTLNSFTPRATSVLTSSSISSIGRDLYRPVMSGMAQKAQNLLHPSAILRYAWCEGVVMTRS